MIIEPRELTGDIDTGADVCIVGSGAGGAVAACELSEAGLSVAVIEEGKHYPEAEMRAMKPSEALRHLYRSYGAVAPLGQGDTPAIPVLVGKAVGGSSLLTGGVIYRTPERIVDSWNRRFGFKEVTNKALEPVFEDLERELPVEETPKKLRSESTKLFQKGADALGYSTRPIKRNMVGCKGCSQCNFYCPHGAKKSVDTQFIPRSREAGARYYTECKATRIYTALGKVQHVEARFRGVDGKTHRLRVRCKVLVLAAGTLYTPALLLASGIRGASKMVGENLSIHPSFRAYAEFDHDVYGWRGALQSVEMNQFVDEGLTFNAIFVPPSFTSGGLPNFGAENRRMVSEMKRLAMFGGMVEDESTGRVRALPGGDPLITYRLPVRVKDEMVRCSKILAEVFFAAGARRVFTSMHSVPPLTGMDDVRAVNPAHVRGRDFESVAFHPLGTCRMGADPRDSVVDEGGRLWDLPNLYIADGSVVPTSIRVNSQMTVMAMSKWVSRHIVDARRSLLL